MSRWHVGACAVLMLVMFPLKALAAEPELASGPDRELGPFLIRSADGQHALRLGLGTQFRFTLLAPDLPGAEPADLTFVFRRLRLSLRGAFFEDLIDFKAQVNAVPGELELIDLLLEFRAREALRLRIGQFHTPFTRYRLQSFSKLVLPDWSVITEAFGAERQLGFAMHNGYDVGSGWGYAVGAFTGVNARDSHAILLPELYGRRNRVPADLADPDEVEDIHPELFARVSYGSPGFDAESDSDEEGGPLRYGVILSGAWDLAPEVGRDLSWRAAPELLLKAHGLSVLGTLFLSGARRGEAPGGGWAFSGGLGQVAYRWRERYELAFRYSRVSVDSSLALDASNRASRLIAQAADAEEAAALRQQLEGAGALRRVDEYNLGFNLYLVGHSLKWQSDVTFRADRLQGNDALQQAGVRTQLQLVF